MTRPLQARLQLQEPETSGPPPGMEAAVERIADPVARKLYRWKLVNQLAWQTFTKPAGALLLVALAGCGLLEPDHAWKGSPEYAELCIWPWAADETKAEAMDRVPDEAWQRCRPNVLLVRLP